MASEDIISRLSKRLSLATSNNREMPDMGTRNIGGSFRKNHPYISGYFYAIFALPETLFSGVQDLSSKWLSSTCESFTPPSDTINTTELTGLGQVKSRFYTSRTVTNDITLAFREYQNLPVLNVLSQWVSFIDPFVGASSMGGNNFIPSVYKGTLYVLQTKPTGATPNQHIQIADVEEAWVFDGVFPTALPYDSLSSDITTADSVQLSVNFSFDGYPMRTSEGAAETCLEAYRALGHTSLTDSYQNFLDKGPHKLSGTSSIG